MAMGRLPSVWVSGIQPPVSAKEISNHFEKVANIQSVVVPDPTCGELALVVKSHDDQLQLLMLDGHEYNDIALRIQFPTASQLDIIDKFSSSESDDDTLNKLVDLLTSLPPEKFDRLWALLQKKSTVSTPCRDTKIPEHQLFQATNVDKKGKLFPSSSDISDFGQFTSHNMPYYTQCRISLFSGDNSKGEVDYSHWRHEVQSLITEACPSNQLLPAIRKSLKGTAADVLLNMGMGVSAQAILEKFDVIFGNVLSSETLMEDFYTARQKAGESIASWACRLECLLAKATQGSNTQCDASTMLRTKFWGGLVDERIKTGIRHRYDAGHPFTVLLQAARQIEHERAEMPTSSGQQKPKSSAQTVGDTIDMSKKLDELTRLVAEMSSRLQRVEKGQTNPPKPNHHYEPRLPPTCFYCHEVGHIQRRCPKKSGNEQ